MCSGASGAAGGYAVPREIDQIIDATLKGISPIRAIANVVRTGTAGYRKLVTSGGIVSGWASETGARAETATPSFNEIVPPSGELRSEEHTSELQSLMRISYAVFCLKKKKKAR